MKICKYCDHDIKKDGPVWVDAETEVDSCPQGAYHRHYHWPSAS